jgi:hypothetical protein
MTRPGKFIKFLKVQLQIQSKKRNYLALNFLAIFHTVFLMKRDGNCRVYERPPKMLGDGEFDKKSYWRSLWKLSTEVTIFKIEKF